MQLMQQWPSPANQRPSRERGTPPIGRRPSQGRPLVWCLSTAPGLLQPWGLGSVASWVKPGGSKGNQPRKRPLVDRRCSLADSRFLQCWSNAVLSLIQNSPEAAIKHPFARLNSPRNSVSISRTTSFRTARLPCPILSSLPDTRSQWPSRRIITESAHRICPAFLFTSGDSHGRTYSFATRTRPGALIPMDLRTESAFRRVFTSTRQLSVSARAQNPRAAASPPLTSRTRQRRTLFPLSPAR